MQTIAATFELTPREMSVLVGIVDAGDTEWRGHVVGVPPLRFADLANMRRLAGGLFHLDEIGADAEAGGNETAFLVVRQNGELTFVSAEMPKVDLVEGDRVVRILRSSTSSLAA